MNRRGLTFCLCALAACGDTTAPRSNVVVTVTPGIVGSFSGLGGTHELQAEVTDTLGNPIDATVSWTVSPQSASMTISPAGVVTVDASAEPGVYDVRARVQEVVGGATVSVLPRPAGKLVFTSSAGGESRIYVKDLSNDADAVELALDVESIFGLAVDQSNGRIFFSAGTLPNVDIYRVNADGSELQNLTNSPASSNQGPTIHPVTRLVYFTRRVSNVGQVFRMTQDGGDVTQVSTGTQSKTNAAISPDGESLAWGELYQPGFNSEIVIADVEGSNPVRLTDRAGSDHSPFWVARDRIIWSWLAVGTDPELFSSTVPPSGDFINLTNVDGADFSPSAGCSSNAFTFISTREGVPEAYQYDLASGLVVKFTLAVVYPMTVVRRLCS